MAEIIKEKNYLFKMSDSIPISRSFTYNHSSDKAMIYVDTLGSFICKNVPNTIATLVHASYCNTFLRTYGYSDTKMRLPKLGLALREVKDGESIEDLLSTNVTPQDYFKGNIYSTYHNVFYSLFDFLDVTYKGHAGFNNNDTKMLGIVRIANDILCKYFYREIHAKSPMAEALQYQIASTIFYEFHEYFKGVDEIRNKYNVKMVYESQYLKDYYTIIEAPKLVREYIKIYCIPKYVDYRENYHSIYPKIILLHNVPKYGNGKAFFIGMEYFLEFIKNNLHYNGNIPAEIIQKFVDSYAINGYYHAFLNTSKVSYKGILSGNITPKHLLQAPIEQKKAKYPYHPFIITN